MVRDIAVAMMVTMDEEGRFRGRPMRAVKQEFIPTKDKVASLAEGVRICDV